MHGQESIRKTIMYVDALNFASEYTFVTVKSLFRAHSLPGYIAA